MDPFIVLAKLSSGMSATNQWASHFGVYYENFTWIFFTYCVLSYAGLTWLVFGIYSKFERAKINFYITDFWIVMVLLGPSFYLFAFAMDPKNAEIVAECNRDWVSVTPGLAILFLSQCSGMFFGRMLSAPRAGEHLPRQWDQAYALVLGALSGLLLLIPVMASLAVVAFALLLIIPIWPFWVVFFVLRYRDKR